MVGVVGVYVVGGDGVGNVLALLFEIVRYVAFAQCNLCLMFNQQ